MWCTMSQKYAGGMDHDHMFITQHPGDLSWPSTLFQLQGEHVVIPLEAYQDPLAVVHTLACQFKCVNTVTQVSADT